MKDIDDDDDDEYDDNNNIGKEQFDIVLVGFRVGENVDRLSSFSSRLSSWSVQTS